MTTIEKQQHIGIYGLIERDEKIVVIRKSRGPYIGMYDLPGGRPSHGELLLDALIREISEETGINAKSFMILGNFSYLVPYRDVSNNQKELYHIALVYRVVEMDMSGYNPHIKEEDVNGSEWISRAQLSKANSSPVLNSILEG